jgi:hypothetical protein
MALSGFARQMIHSWTYPDIDWRIPLQTWEGFEVVPTINGSDGKDEPIFEPVYRRKGTLSSTDGPRFGSLSRADTLRAPSPKRARPAIYNYRCRDPIQFYLSEITDPIFMSSKSTSLLGAESLIHHRQRVNCHEAVQTPRL